MGGSSIETEIKTLEKKRMQVAYFLYHNMFAGMKQKGNN